MFRSMTSHQACPGVTRATSCAAPLGRVLPGPLDDHALLPWRFHPVLRAADGHL